MSALLALLLALGPGQDPGKGPPVADPRPPKAPPGAPAPPERLDTFDPQGLQLSWASRRWQLLLPGGQVLKDFGTREQEAREALRLIQELHLNQHAVLGSPGVMEYWLSDGHAPEGLPAGARVLPLVSAGLRVEQDHGQWVLRDPQRVLFNFGAQADEARHALELIRRHDFSRVAVVGQGVPTMMVFLAGQGGPGAHAAGLGTQADRHRHVSHFSRQSRPPQMPAGKANPPVPPDLVAPAVPGLASGPPPPRGWRTQPHFGPAAAPAPSASGPPPRVAFDWRQVELRQDNGDWQLRAGSLVLAHFGADQHDARLALMAVRHYRFTEQWRVPAEGAPFTYYLAYGQAPRGMMMGLAGQAFVPEALAVRQDNGHWAVAAGDKVVVSLGPKEEEARALLEVIKRNRFDRLCRLGGPSPLEALAPPEARRGEPEGMTLLIRSR
jgi:hypothetical protein